MVWNSLPQRIQFDVDWVIITLKFGELCRFSDSSKNTIDLKVLIPSKYYPGKRPPAKNAVLQQYSYVVQNIFLSSKTDVRGEN